MTFFFNFIIIFFFVQKHNKNSKILTLVSIDRSIFDQNARGRKQKYRMVDKIKVEGKFMAKNSDKMEEKLRIPLIAYENFSYGGFDSADN